MYTTKNKPSLQPSGVVAVYSNHQLIPIERDLYFQQKNRRHWQACCTLIEAIFRDKRPKTKLIDLC